MATPNTSGVTLETMKTTDDNTTTKKGDDDEQEATTAAETKKTGEAAIKTTTNDVEDTPKSCSAGGKWISYFLSICSFITFQYTSPLCKQEKKNDASDNNCHKLTCCIFMLPLTLVFIVMHIIPLAFFIHEWIYCPYDYKTDICFTMEPFTMNNRSQLAKIVLRDTDTLDTDVKRGLMQEFIDFSKVALLFSTTANAVSHILFIFSLWALYFMQWEKVNDYCIKKWKKFKESCCGIPKDSVDSNTFKPLDPFDIKYDDEDNFDSSCMDSIYNKKEKKFFEKRDDRTSTPLQGARSWHFIIWFFIGLSLIAITAAVLFPSLDYNRNESNDEKENKNNETDNTSNATNEKEYNKSAFGYEMSALALYFASLFRVLVSCFIFSKLMYGIQRRCEELELYVIYINEKYDKINENDEVNKYLKGKKLATDDKKTLALKYLINRDKDFVEKAKATLNWIQFWFLFHWVLHIISTFMVVTLFIDAITLLVKDNIKHVQIGIKFHEAEIGFLFMYSVVQCFFLLHPCLRAASVTRTRQRVIRRISDKYKFSNLSDDIIPQFAESMKRQKFSFRLRILCASIPFNLNIAYLSIAFAFVGIVVSLITSVRSTDFQA